MNQLDPVKQAAALLRSQHTGHTSAPGHTRARVMASLHQQKKSRSLRWTTLVPICLVLFGGTAWAQSSGALPRIWATFISAVSPFATDKQALAERELARRAARNAAAPRKGTPASKPVEAQPPAAQAEEPPTDSAPQPSAIAETPSPRAPGLDPKTKAHRGKAGPRGPAAKAPAQETAVPPQAPPVDAELTVFRAAHDLHYSGSSPAAAISAYEAYLKGFPQGRFRPEAHYNIGVGAVRLKRVALAKTHLLPFARGEHGNYRKRDATQLLEQLGVSP